MAAIRRQKENGRAEFEKREKRRTIRFLMEEIGKNNIARVKEMLCEDFDVDFQYRGQTALQLAVREGHYDICKLLLEKGANANKCDAELNNLLNMACWRGYSNVAQLLINNNAHLDARNDYGSTSLNTSVYKGYELICQNLIKANCDLDIPNTKGQSPLHTAVRGNRKDLVNLLVNAKCDIDNQDEEQRTPLTLAAQLGHSDIVSNLIDAGADVNLQDKFGRCPLYEASSRGFLEIVKSIVSSRKAQLDICTRKGATSLLESVRQNYVEVASLLIESGCNPDLADQTKQSPIHAAVRQVSQFFESETLDKTELVRRLIEAECDVNVTDSQGWCPLYQSAFAGDTELTKLLLYSGAKLNALTITKESVLHGAVSSNVPEIVDLLLLSGCNVNMVNQKGEHALYTAVKTRADIKIIKSLIKAGSDLNIRELDQLNSPLHEALLQHHTEAALELLKSGCDFHIRNSKCQDPMYTACEKGNDKVLDWLLKTQKREFKGDFSYPLPLHAAVCSGQSRTAVMLLEAGYDINQLNEKCMSPLQTAASEDNYSMAKLLLQYGGDLGAHRKVNEQLNCCLQCEDAHPHFELEPMFFAVKNRNIELMKLFLACYFHPPYSMLKTIGAILQSTPELYSHYPIEMRREILQLFVRTICVPQTLQDLCRSVILETIGSCPHKKVPVLPLANKVKEFLLRKGFFDALAEEDSDPGTHHSNNYSL